MIRPLLASLATLLIAPSAQAGRTITDCAGRDVELPERGEALALDAEATFARIDAILADVPESERPRADLAHGPDGLESGVVGAINTGILERAGGINVLGSSTTASGLVQVNFEALLRRIPTSSSRGTGSSTKATK